MPYGENSSCNSMLKAAMTHKGDVHSSLLSSKFPALLKSHLKEQVKD